MADEDHPASSSEASAFYDDYVDRQSAVGINDRHRAILRWLEQFGLRPEHRVLEIGCGIGTVTELLAKRMRSRGRLVGVDLSPRSVEVAAKRLAAFPNVRMVAGDVMELEFEGGFDVILLPDVIEHIPLEQHRALLARLSSWLAPEGFVLLHYPNPWYLEWCREHAPELLQIIDQPIHADVLLAHAYACGLYLEFLKTYSIWIREGDYVVAVLRPVSGVGTFTELPEPAASIVARIAGRLRRVIG